MAELRALPSLGVLLSGGVDSAVMAKAAFLALGEKAVAFTGVSDSLAEGELQQARSVAERIGIRHEIIATQEQASPEYRRNAPDRCFHCKTELYTKAQEIAQRLGVTHLANGANADDVGDHRPGMRAARDFDVLSPLLSAGLTKEEVRALARHWELPVAEKPAAPCLASRVAYGVEVTPKRLKKIDAAEQWLREHGVSPVRVRLHAGEVARIEAPPEWIARLAADPLRSQLNQHLTALGFTFVTIDLGGFRSGSLNAAAPVDQLERISDFGFQRAHKML